MRISGGFAYARPMLTALRLLLFWLGAYVTLMIIFTLFGDGLGGLPLWLRVLFVSAALTIVMSQVVIPIAIRLTRPRD